jgi:N-methylhydantoinase A
MKRWCLEPVEETIMKESEMKRGGWMLGSDIGGTFTDLFLYHPESERTAILKVPSTPEDPSVGLLDGVAELLAREKLHAGNLDRFVHGTTVATNALLEHKGAPTGLITTRGFRDLLEIARQRRPTLYDLFFDKPAPLIPRRLRLEVTERCDYTGRVIVPLDMGEVEAAIVELKEERVKSIAVCFLYSFMNHDHELAVVDRIRELFPEAFVCASCQVLPEWREYERVSTTTANAYLGPAIKGYMNHLQARTREMGIPTEPRIMQSNGGIMSISAASERSAYTLFSGPSAGVIGGHYVAGLAGFRNIITFDMGGTSTDVSLGENGAPKHTTENEIGGVPLRVPMIDIYTVGAGGGSIAWIDSGGLMKVGPQSMGANPGPACYALGGKDPTVTDMNVVLGRLNPEYLLGGRMRIERKLALRAIEETLARPLGLTLEEAAAGILTIVNTNMMLATRLVSIQRGYDPRDFVLVAFGGAGPLHACAVARELNIGRVLVPPAPGLICALGLLVADTRADYVLTRKLPVAEANFDEINEVFGRLESKAHDWLTQERVSPERMSFQRSVDMRYSKQNYELSVPAMSGVWDQESVVEITRRFHDSHEKAYGYSASEEPVDFINFRVTAIGLTDRPLIRPSLPFRPGTSPEKPETRQVFFEECGFVLCPVFDRASLSPQHRLEGPTIIEQEDATTVVLPGQTAETDQWGNLIIKVN